MVYVVDSTLQGYDAVLRGNWFSDFMTILPQNVRNQLPSDAKSHPRIMESPATPLQRPGVCSLSKDTLMILPMYYVIYIHPNEIHNVAALIVY